MTTREQLDARYGRTRSRSRLPWILGGIAAAAVVITAGWITVAGTLDDVDVTGTGFQVHDAGSVTVSFQITAPADRPVVCVLEALDEQFGVVGWRVVQFDADAGHARAFSETIPTVAIATTGLVNSCWVA